jgi:hypothetical protein
MVTNQQNESVPAITSEKRPPDADPVPPCYRARIQAKSGASACVWAL